MDFGFIFVAVDENFFENNSKRFIAENYNFLRFFSSSSKQQAPIALTQFFI
jgi:hypothetical protein